MKIKHLFFLIACSLILFSSCEKTVLEEITEDIKQEVTIQEVDLSKAQPANQSANKLVQEGGKGCHSNDPNLRVLFIGNSYTANFTTDIPAMFGDLASFSGQSVANISVAAANGFTLADHLNNTTVVNVVNQGNWDYVILQENSGYLANGNSVGFTNSVNSFVNLIDNNSPSAKIILYQVVPPVSHTSTNFGTLQSSWNTLYAQVAFPHNNVFVCNVGRAFQVAYSGGPLALGYTVTNPDELRYGAQFGYHFDNSGGFLGAVSFYTMIFNEKPCIPTTMNFYPTSGSVSTNVPQFHILAQIGYLNSLYDIYNSIPLECQKEFLYTTGNYPC